MTDQIKPDKSEVQVDLPFKMRALANFIRKLVCNGDPDDTAAIQAQACEEAADEIELLTKFKAFVHERVCSIHILEERLGPGRALYELCKSIADARDRVDLGLSPYSGDDPR